MKRKEGQRDIASNQGQLGALHFCLKDYKQMQTYKAGLNLNSGCGKVGGNASSS